MIEDIIIIAALDENNIIGNKRKLPWKIPEELAHFKKTTLGQVVLMGRNTWESLDEKYKPLPNRINLVLTSNPPQTNNYEQTYFLSSSCEVIHLCSQKYSDKKLYVCGGEQIYRTFMPISNKLILSRIKGKFEGDTCFPQISDAFELIRTDDREKFIIEEYLRKKENYLR